MNLKTVLDQVTCARLPATALIWLAGLRRVEEISVLQDGDDAWVFWEQGDDQVVRALLPVSGVEFFEQRGDAWHLAGRRMPSFGVPPAGDRVPLSRAVTPEPFSVVFSATEDAPPSRLQLARDGRVRATTASACPLAELGRWADSAPSSAIEGLRGAIQGDLAVLLGRTLPPWPGSTRYWGRRILVPIGFEPRPGLPEEALTEALGASSWEILRLIPEGDGLVVEAIPLEAFRPLSRAGVRLALGSRRS